MKAQEKLTLTNLTDGADLFASTMAFFNKAIAMVVSAGLIAWAVSAYILCLVFLSAVTRDQFVTILAAKILSAFGGGSFHLNIAYTHLGHVLHESQTATALANHASATWNSAWPKILFFCVMGFPSFFVAAHYFKNILAKTGQEAANNVHLRGALIVDAERLNEVVVEKYEDEIIRRAIVLEKRMKAI